MKKPTVAFASAQSSSSQSQINRFSNEQAADLQRRIEEATRKVNAAKVKGNLQLVRRYTPSPCSLTDNFMETGVAIDSPASGSATPQGNGLKMSAHPLLLEATSTAPQSKKDRYKPMQPKFATLKVFQKCFWESPI
jgi:U4/U6 small nuclear ribonucleoprotein PRP3